jgi:hypothetical protein
MIDSKGLDSSVKIWYITILPFLSFFLYGVPIGNYGNVLKIQSTGKENGFFSATV